MGLIYSSGSSPGFSRVKRGKGFAYLDPSGQPVQDEEALSRIRGLMIPPAWSEVWICLHENGHLQATGRDQKGRRQAIYHPDFRSFREEVKFGSLKEFGMALPTIRSLVAMDVARRGVVREKVLATVVQLLESTLIRVGNRRYAVENASYGLTTLEANHVSVGTEKLLFKFRGKSGKYHEVEHRDRRLARIVRNLQGLPGQALFQYLDEDGIPKQVTSDDVNAYLREISGRDTTAKEFRTWRATVEALRLLRLAAAEGAIAKRKINEIVKQVSVMLGNTPSICRKSYIHPLLLENTNLNARWLKAKLPRSTRWLEPVERLAIDKLL